MTKTHETDGVEFPGPPWIDRVFKTKSLGSFTCIRDDRHKLARELMALVDATHNSQHGPFCIWLLGPLGAGKTTLTGALLAALGYPPDLPVLSPTYTLMSDYQISIGGQTQWFAHLDLYRLGDAPPSLEDFGIVDAHRYRGLFIEWPDRALGDPSMIPTHMILLDFGGSENERQLKVLQVIGPKS